MTFDVEVLLKGTDAVVTETVTHEAETSGWADADVREVLLATLRVFARASGDDTAGGNVTLRGLSWIVTETEGGGRHCHRDSQWCHCGRSVRYCRRRTDPDGGAGDLR